MATEKCFQLLKLPDFLKESHLPNWGPDHFHHSMPLEKPHQLLSMPSKPANDVMPKLVIIPGLAHSTPPSMPLLKLPIHKPQSNRGSKYQISISNDPKHYHLPLLKKPLMPKENSLVKLPIQPEKQLVVPNLIQFPKAEPILAAQRTVIPQAAKENRHQNDQQADVKEVLKDHGYEVQSIETNNEKVQTAKRKRRRKKSSLIQAKNKMQSQCKEEKTKHKEDERWHSKISQSTQTTVDVASKLKVRKKKLSLMALLEHAALLDGGSGSSDDEVDLRMLKDKSYLVKEEPYLEPIGQQNKKTAARKTMVKPTIEQLLLQNFEHQHTSDPKRTFELQEPLRKQELDKKERNAGGQSTISQNAESINAFHDVKIQKMTLTDKPKASVGSAWKELIGLSNGSSTVDVSAKNVISLKEIGIQVTDSNPSFDKIAQASQTDFAKESDVASMLLQNLREERGIQDEPASKERIVMTELTDNYPWKYIADTDFSDVMLQERLEAKRKEGEYGSLENNAQRRNVLPSSGSDSKSTNDKKAKGRAEIQQSNRVHMPPNIVLGMKIEEDCIQAGDINSTQLNEPMNVVDISRPASPITNSNEHIESIVIKEIAAERIMESIEYADEIDIADSFRDNMQRDINNREVYNATDESIMPGDRGFKENQRKKQTGGLETQRIEPNRKSEVATRSQKLNELLEAGPKDRLHNNLRNMSVQLDALDELYEHLEKELKTSSSLMQTVQTLHHGFLEEPEVFKRKPIQKSPWQKPLQTRFHEQDLRRSEVSLGKKTTVHEEIVSTRREEVISTEASIEENDLNFEEVDISIKEKGEVSSTGDLENEESDVGSEEGVENHSLLSKFGLESNASEQISDFIASSRDSERKIRNTNEEISDDGDLIRQRISNKYPTISMKRREEEEKSKEMDLKLKIERKRQALRDWMKKKRSEQNQKYLLEIGERRQKESRPFVSAKSNTPQPHKKFIKSGKENMNIKKATEEESFRERVDGAQQLLDDILVLRSDVATIEKSSRPILALQEKRRQNRVSRYQRDKLHPKSKRNLSRVYTGDSFRRKSATGKQKRPKERNTGPGKWLLDNISPSWKFSDIAFEEEFLKNIDGGKDELPEENLSFLELDGDDDLEPYSSTARSSRRGYKLDLGSLTDRQSPDHGSARSKSLRSVEGKDFVTNKSMENYRKKTAKLVRKSLREYDLSESEDGYRDFGSSMKDKSLMLSSDGLNQSDRLMLERILNERRSIEDDHVAIDSKRQRTRNSNGNKEDVDGILRQYGLLDDDMEGYDVLETSQLLAEADAVLESAQQGKEGEISAESINWDEINNILNQN